MQRLPSTTNAIFHELPCVPYALLLQQRRHPPPRPRRDSPRFLNVNTWRSLRFDWLFRCLSLRGCAIVCDNFGVSHFVPNRGNLNNKNSGCAAVVRTWVNTPFLAIRSIPFLYIFGFSFHCGLPAAAATAEGELKES